MSRPLPFRYYNERLGDIVIEIDTSSEISGCRLAGSRNNCVVHALYLSRLKLTIVQVGRLKVEAPTRSGHAFILRRFDTGAVSATAMFHAAFPNCPEDLEKSETQWVKTNYDTAGANGSSKDANEAKIVRLAGTWVHAEDARELASDYALGDLIQRVIDAVPDPNISYKTKKPVSTPKAAAAAAPSQPPPSMIPVPQSPVRHQVPLPPVRPSSPVKPPSSSGNWRPQRITRSSRSPAPRPPSKVVVAKPPSKTLPPVARTPPRQTKSRRLEALTSSDNTVVDEEDEMVQERAMKELHDQDVAEQKSMIAGLKAKVKAEGDELKTTSSSSSKPKPDANSGGVAVAPPKREREDEDVKLTFNFREAKAEPEKRRVIATNRRVSAYARLPPQQKSVLWGALAFAVGVGLTLAPSYL
ncbi:hypothetical protein FISHEDRAFT_77768 [Fistulina hepatica ATCC 64428]|nr:hypothetical protein FISHEDRAFT_77768 [Fistulina hepatica ATCC 64428]